MSNYIQNFKYWFHSTYYYSCSKIKSFSQSKNLLFVNIHLVLSKILNLPKELSKNQCFYNQNSKYYYFNSLKFLTHSYFL